MVPPINPPAAQEETNPYPPLTPNTQLDPITLVKLELVPVPLVTEVEMEVAIDAFRVLNR